MNEWTSTSGSQPMCQLENLKQRAKLLRKLRAFFDDRGFFEVETPLISSDVVVDRHIEPIEVTDLQSGLPGSKPRFWLQTSPEFAMKRLLAAGADKIYQICKAFRNSERGQQHNPEFTMLEWYRVGDNYEQGRRLLAEFAQEVFECDQIDQVTYADVFRAEFGLCPLTCNLSELLQIAESRTNVVFERSESRDEILNAILSACIEPTLGLQRPLILFDFPASQSALAKIRSDEVPVAERFELYFQGVELANGYHELSDAEELLERNKIVNGQRVVDGKSELPNESRLMGAMQSGLPDCCGVAVGVDRLLMLLLSEDSIDQVIAFPIELA